jgi:hypothetical protein
VAIDSVYRTETERLFVRLDEASAAVEGYYAQWKDELEVRDKLVLELVDAGNEILQVARRARVSPCRVNQIIAREWPR